jgi:predicted permease
MTLLQDLKFAVRSLWKAKGLSLTVIVTLALGIGANSAIFSLVRGVLLKPLANRDEDRLIYIRQSAPGLKLENAAFSVPELIDLKSRVRSITAFGDFSTIGFTMVGLGEPRTVRAGVVGGSYFEVMGLRPVLGRLLGPSDDGPNAPGAAVLTHRFWTTGLKSDPSVLGKTIRLGTRSATMVTGRVHRMTELFGRLAPGADLETARTELRTIHASIVKQYPEAYSPKADFRIDAVLLRDQITSRARTVLWVLLAASALVFLIACSNVANLILARTMRRESELAVRAALGAGTGALRQTLLAESLLLCGAGAILAMCIAGPMLSVLAKYASRFSVRALDLTVEPSMLVTGLALALFAAVLLAYVPKLPSADSAHGTSLAMGSSRIVGGATKRQRIFAVTQIAASFVLLAGASMLVNTLIALQSAPSGFDTARVLVVDVPVMSYGKTPEQVGDFYREVTRKIGQLPGVNHVSIGSAAPWRDGGNFGPGFQFSADGYVLASGEEYPRARFRTITPGYFASLGVPIIAGRDFDESDRTRQEPVVIVSQSIAPRLFSTQDALNRHIMWTDPVMKFIDVSTGPRRIVGISADVDDENVVPGPAMTVYHPFGQTQLWGGRLFVHTGMNPYSIAPQVTQIIRNLSAEQPVERASTLEDIRAEVLAPERLNTLVFGGFALVALAIAIVGVGGVLAFSVSGRIREFGIRMAVGSEPKDVLAGVLKEGLLMAALGVAAGAVAGFALSKVAGTNLREIQVPGALPVAGSASVLIAAAVIASLLPAARAARIDIMEALRAD